MSYGLHPCIVYTLAHLHTHTCTVKRGWGDELLCGSVRTTYSSQAWPSTVIAEADRKTPGLIRLNSTPDVTLATTCTVHMTHIQNTFRLLCKCTDETVINVMLTLGYHL